MRCYTCNKRLTDYEATLRICATDEYPDMCLDCLKGLQIEVKGNPALKGKLDTDVEETYNEDDYFDDFSDIPVGPKKTDWSED